MITKTLVNKFIVSLVSKALGDDFFKALGNGVLLYESLEGRRPNEAEFKRDFLRLMESFYQNINLFMTAVQEYLSDREEDEDTVRRVAEALGVEMPGMQSPENKEETLKSAAQRLTENPKPAPRKRKKRPACGVQKSAVQGRDPKTGRFLKKEA